MTMTEISETGSGLQLPSISTHDPTPLSHQQVSYLAVPSHIRQKHNLDSAAKAEITSTRHHHELTGTTTPPRRNKPIPTFGVGKMAPRGFPSVARRTRIFGNPSQIRRYSLPRTKSLDDCSTVHENQENPPTAEFNTTLLVPTLYLPNDDGDNASDLVTIPSSYMLPSIHEQTEVRYGSSDHGSMDDRDKDIHLPKLRDYIQGRRGSSVSAIYRHEEAEPTLQEKVEEELEKNQNALLEESIENETEPEMEGGPSNSEGPANEAGPVSPGKSSRLAKSETIVFQPSKDDDKENVNREDIPSVTPQRFVSPTRKTLMDQTGFVDPNAKSRAILARSNKGKQDKPAEVDDFDPLSIIRASMNRMRRREAGVAGSTTDKSDTTVVQPLTLISLQRSHLLHVRPALAMTPTKGMRRPEVDTSFLPEIPGQDVGTGYLALEKFTFVCSWLRTVEEFREQGLLDGDFISDSELAWAFTSDYTPNLGNLEIHRGSI